MHHWRHGNNINYDILWLFMTTVWYLFVAHPPGAAWRGTCWRGSAARFVVHLRPVALASGPCWKERMPGPWHDKSVQMLDAGTPHLQLPFILQTFCVLTALFMILCTTGVMEQLGTGIGDWMSRALLPTKILFGHRKGWVLVLTLELGNSDATKCSTKTNIGNKHGESYVQHREVRELATDVVFNYIYAIYINLSMQFFLQNS